MMKHFSACLLAVTCLTGTATTAQGMDPMDAAIHARQSHMGLQALFIGTLGGMAQEKIPYDAALATAAAGNLAAIAALDYYAYWPEGSGNDQMEDTKALPAIWQDPAGFEGAHEALITATAGLAAVAGDGLDALKAGFGPVGAACGDCHQNFRTR